MTVHKYDHALAERPVKLIRSDAGDTRNMRILLARGLRQEVAERVVRMIREGGVTDPDAYAWAVVADRVNLDEKYLAWQADEDIFNPELWAEFQDTEIEYTKPIRRRLKQRADAKREELRLQAVMEDEAFSFWRADTRRPNTGSTRAPARTIPYPNKQRA